MTVRAVSYTSTPVPTSFERLMLNRMGTGFSQGSLKALRAAGGANAWFTKQLSPSTVTEAAIVSSIDSWYGDQKLTPEAKYRMNRAGTKSAVDFGRELGSWSMLRRIHSTRMVLETMVGFWSDHLHVPCQYGVTSPPRFSYDAVIRKNALGKFDELLLAAATHPAMLLYLDNFRAVAGRPNENQGRELLEIHTVGRGSGYTEAMVRSSAILMSGWSVDYPTSFTRSYQPSRHTKGPVTVLGFSNANAAADGQALSESYLRYLAHHPATARRIATKLATYFVSEVPSAALVDKLATTFLSSGTDIRATLKALVAHPEFIASEGKLIRTPIEETVATARVLRVTPTGATGHDAYANLLPYLFSGEKLYMWGRPDGAPRHTSAICSPARILASSETHWRMAGSYFPSKQITYQTPASWLPTTKIRFDMLVDHLSRRVLGRPSTTVLLQACIAGTGVTAGTYVTKSHKVIIQNFGRLMSCFLEAPAHMSR